VMDLLGTAAHRAGVHGAPDGVDAADHPDKQQRIAEHLLDRLTPR